MVASGSADNVINKILNQGEITIPIGEDTLIGRNTIDTLKKTVPIWKKEHFEDGEVWVNSTP